MEPAGGQPAVQGSINECGEVLRVENLARNWDRCDARDEIGCQELALGVPTNGRENILAILLEPALPDIGIES